MCKIIDIFYGYEEISEILFFGIQGLSTSDQLHILNQAVAAIDKLLPYNWDWEVAKYRMKAPVLYNKMEINETFRDIMWTVVNHIRKELLA